MLLWYAAVLAFSFSFIRAEDVPNGLKLKCLDDTLPRVSEKPEDLIKALSLEQNYKLVVRYTDEIQNTSSKISESNFTDSFVIKKEQLGVEETFLINNRTIRYKGGDCSLTDSTNLRPVYNISEQIRTLLKNNALNLEDILIGILNVNFIYEKVNTMPVWVDGNKAVSWTGCINQTDKTPGIEIGINFIGSKSVKSYSDYENPKVATVRVVVYKAGNISAPKANITYIENYSLNVVELEHTKSEHKLKATQIPRGVFCTNMTSAKVPSKLPIKFEAEIEYSDVENKITDTVSLMYDGLNHVVSFALDFDNDLDIPYTQNSAQPKQIGKARIIQDFNSGFEYTLSKDGRVCNKVAPIQKTWSNVIELNNTLILRTPTNVFFNISQQKVYYAGQVSEGGILYDSYVSKKISNDTTKDYIVIELLFTLPDWSSKNDAKSTIHSIIQYHKKANHELTKTTITRFNSLQNSTQTGISWAQHSIYPCFTEVPIDNFFFFKLADVSMKTIQSYGYENVESALSEALAKTANISVLRVSQFLFKTVENELLACFLLGEKINSTPATTKYLINEKTIQEVRTLLNETLKTQKIVINLVTNDLKPVTISVNELGMVSTKEHIQPIPMTGYSGGSMFILAMFSFMFGAGGAVGGYVLYNKRQQVRGIAYQVFE